MSGINFYAQPKFVEKKFGVKLERAQVKGIAKLSKNRRSPVLLC